MNRAVTTDWALRAACTRLTDPDVMFGPPRGQADAARAVCGPCPVRFECAAEALDQGREHGVWGGLTETQRRAMRRARPDVARWRPLLVAALDRAAAHSGGAR